MTLPDLRDLLVNADSITSEIGHRYKGRLPDDVVDDLLVVSSECRKLAEALADDHDALAVQVAEARWPGRYVGDLTGPQWDEIYDFIRRDRAA